MTHAIDEYFLLLLYILPSVTTFHGLAGIFILANIFNLVGQNDITEK